MPAVAERIEAHGKAYEIEVDPESVLGRKVLRLHQPYEYGLLQLIYALGLEGTAVDVGANCGNHSLWLAAVCGLKVHAFEPVTTNELRQNVLRNGLRDQVAIYDIALGQDIGYAKDLGVKKGTINDTEAEGEYNTWGYFHKLKLDFSYGDIPIMPLDSFNITEVSLLKIDVEGAESDVLRGGEETIRRDHPVIFAEVLNQRLHDEMASVLEPWGYERVARFRSGTPMEQWAYA